MAANEGEPPPPPPPPPPPAPAFMIEKLEGCSGEDDDRKNNEKHPMMLGDHNGDDEGGEDCGEGNITRDEMKGTISIAERRAAKYGFNAANISGARLGGVRATAAAIGLSPRVRSPYVTIPAGISPSALLGSPVMLPNAQAQFSPTTGTAIRNEISQEIRVSFNDQSDYPENGSEDERKHRQKPVFHYPGTTSSSIPGDFFDPQSAIDIEQPAESREFSCGNLSSQDGEDQNQLTSPDSISFKDEDCENGGCEPKRRKRENLANETTARGSARESKVIVQIESDVDILDDGYRWRKYGQKVVKGNPNPRSYYKCTTPGCPVRKHVERVANDRKSVQTTYEGKHSHQVPATKTSSLAIPDQLLLAAVPSPPQTAQKIPPEGSGKHVPSSYLERKPLLFNYNGLVASYVPTNFSTYISDLSFGPPSSLYPYPFPPFPSLDYDSVSINGGNGPYKPYSKFLPMSLPAQISQVAPATHGPSKIWGSNNMPFSSYGVIQGLSRGHDQMMTSATKAKVDEAEAEGKL